MSCARSNGGHSASARGAHCTRGVWGEGAVSLSGWKMLAGRLSNASHVLKGGVGYTDEHSPDDVPQNVPSGDVLGM